MRRQWRVGSISMGMALVLFGVLILVGELRGWGTSFDIVIRWWPVVLVLAGIEILIAIALSGQENSVLRYDWLGVFVTVTLVLFAAGVYTLTASGVMPAIRSALASASHPVEFGDSTFDLAGVSEVIITVEGSVVEIRALPGEEGDTLTVFGEGRVSASSEEEARRWASQVHVVFRKHGSVLYLSLRAPVLSNGPLGRAFSDVRWVILAPAGKAFEFSTAGATRVLAKGLKGNWLVRASGTVNVELARSDDVRLLVSSWSPPLVSGDLQFDEAGEQGGVEESHVRVIGKKVSRTASVGKASYTLRIDADSQVYVTIDE